MMEGIGPEWLIMLHAGKANDRGQQPRQQATTAKHNNNQLPAKDPDWAVVNTPPVGWQIISDNCHHSLLVGWLTKESGQPRACSDDLLLMVLFPARQVGLPAWFARLVYVVINKRCDWLSWGASQCLLCSDHWWFQLLFVKGMPGID